MNIKIDFFNWMRFAETVNPSFVQAVNSTTTTWQEIGLKEVLTDNKDLTKGFEVIGEHLFFLAVIKYGISFEEV
jgi:hypothetical protein